MDWLVYVIVGAVLLASSGVITNVLVRRRWGRMDEWTMELSKGTGVVPSWVSVMGLAGWALIAIGAVWGITHLF